MERIYINPNDEDMFKKRSIKPPRAMKMLNEKNSQNKNIMDALNIYATYVMKSVATDD